MKKYSTHSTQWFKPWFLFLIFFMFAACSKSKPIAFEGIDITGNTEFAKNFSLLDTNNQTRTLADFKNKIVVLFFGYAHCPDMCPTSMASFVEVLKKLDKQASQVQIIFVSLDPERDTPKLLADYVHAFSPTFIGLRPRDEADLQKMIKDFKVVTEIDPAPVTSDKSQKNNAKSNAEKNTTNNASYTISHTAGSYVFDRDGQLRLFLPYKQTVEQNVHDLQALLQ